MAKLVINHSYLSGEHVFISDSQLLLVQLDQEFFVHRWLLAAANKVQLAHNVVNKSGDSPHGD